MKNQEKMASCLQSIISLVPKDFHIMRGLQILGALFSVKSQNWSKKFVKSPFFANFQDRKFLKAKFGIS